MADIDQESLDLIVQLQLQDVESLAKGKSRQHDAPRDLDLALQLYQAELQSLNAYLADRAMTQSIARAVVQDADAIAEQIRPEQRPTTGPRASASMGPLLGELGPDDAMLARLHALYMDDGGGSVAGDAPESSSWAASRRQPPASSTTHGARGGGGRLAALARRTCTACTDVFPAPSLARCPCSHDYCGGCLRELFSAAMKDESLFPPRCCGQPIPPQEHGMFLTAKIQHDFRAKAIEFSTPNRTYCHSPTCSAFVPARSIAGDRARCVECAAVTCTTCKGAAHDGEDCPEDAATQDLLRVARENGWQRCRDCKSMVELHTGCNHITCRCRAEFCYVCGLRWKTCACPQWDERLLVERAANVVDRDAGAANLNAAELARARLLVQEDLEDHHHCARHAWTRRDGRFRCEECHSILPDYIYECQGCRILACRRCRLNRL